MSSRDFNVVKRVQRFTQINPNQSTTNNIDSTRIKNQYEIQTSQPASTFVSGRELNQTSLVDAKDLNQLPVRTKNYNFGRVQNTDESNIIEYQPLNKAALNSRINAREISSVGKKDNQRYKSLEQQNTFQRRYETSESPIKRRGPLTMGNRGNFNMKRWAYASPQDINKIIVLQRWWRYLLKKYIRFSRSLENSSKNRSKSSQYPKKVDLNSLMKAGENITEKIFPGENDKLIIETRKVEVFKVNKPKQEKQVMVESKESYSESLKGQHKYGQYSEVLEDKNISGRFGQYNTLSSEKKKNGLSLSQPKSIGEFRVGSVEKTRHVDTSMDSKYGKLKKAGENITEKTFPGQNNTLINEKRLVEVYKINKPQPKEGLGILSKEEGKYSESYKDIRKKGQKLTEKIFPGDKDVIDEKISDEEYKFSQSKSRQDVRIDAREKGRYKDNVRDSKVKKKGEQIIETIYPGRDNTLINEVRKVEVFKKHKKDERYDKNIKESEKYGEGIKQFREKSYDGIEKKGENITEKIFPGEKNKLILETRKVEVYKNKRSKYKEELAIDSKESKKYRDTRDEYEFDESNEPGRYAIDVKKSSKYTTDLEKHKVSIVEGRKKSYPKYPRFIERDGITKAFIKEKMAEIWMDENRKCSENKFSIINKVEKRNIRFGTRGLISDKKGFNTENIDETTDLLNTIKQKDNELNNVLNQLKSQLAPRHKSYETNKTGKVSLFGNKSLENDYESKLRQLLKIIKDKDDTVNQLINQVCSNNGITYDIGSRTFEEDQKKDDKSIHSQLRIKNGLDSINKTYDLDTFNT